jgi:hypothetical protein
MDNMNRILLIFFASLCVGRLSGQTVVIVTDVFQEQDKFEQRILDAMIDHADAIIQSSSQSSEIFAFNCSGDGLHHASGMEGVGMHFDSLRNDEISPPLQPIGWKFESDYFIDWAMRTHLPRAANGFQLHILANNLDVDKLSSQFLWPFALVFDCVDNKGKILPGVECIVHSAFNGEVSTQSLNQFSF